MSFLKEARFISDDSVTINWNVFNRCIEFCSSHYESEFYFTVIYIKSKGHSIPNRNSGFVSGGILVDIDKTQVESIASLYSISEPPREFRTFGNKIVAVSYVYRNGSFLTVMGREIY